MEEEKLRELFNSYEYNLEGYHSYIGPQVGDIFELSYSFDQEIMAIEVSLVIEIDELLEKGFKEEEIFEYILKISEFDKKFTNKQNAYLKKSAVVLLKIRSKLYHLKNDNRLNMNLDIFDDK